MSDSDRPVEEKIGLLNGATDVEASSQPAETAATRPVIFGLGLTTLVILYYAICSSTMLVINKLAIYYFPCPTSLLCLQLLSSTAVVWIGNQTGALEADAIDFTKLRKFIWVVVGFVGTVFTNIKVLQHANVETFITFRSSTPLVLSLCDYIFLGRALPTARSWASLVVLLGGSIGYVMFDDAFKVNAYFWLILWYGFFTFDTVYVKHMCDTVKMTNWGRVYYTNAIALVPLAIMLPFLQEHKVLQTISWTPTVLVPVILSCAMGVGMSHSAYVLRDTVSATLFTIVGILCKIVTVVINVLMWDKHAPPIGIAFLLICVLAGTFYEQSPKRQSTGATTPAV